MKRIVLSLVTGWLGGHAGLLTLWDEAPFAADLRQLDDTQVLIKPAWSPDSIAIPLASLRDWVDTAWVEPATAVQPDVRLIFRHGDELAGRLHSMDADWVRITAPWGQDIGIRRNMLSHLVVIPAAKNVILSRPGPRWEWSTFSRNSRGGLREVGTALQFHPIIGGGYTRNVPPFPQRFRLDLRVQTLGSDPMYFLQLSPTVRNTSGFPRIMLQFQQDNLRVNAYGSTMQPGSDARIVLPKNPSGRQDITVFGDMSAGKFQLWINDKRIHAWAGPRHPEGAFPIPYQLTFNSNDQNVRVIERFQLVQWESAPLQENVYVPLDKQHRVLFRNADSLVGQVKGCEEGRFELFNDEDTSLRVPISSVDRITFPNAGAKKTRRNSRDVLMMLGPTMDRLTLQLTELNEEELVGKSECFDVPLRIPLAHISFLRFNPYQSASRKLASVSP